MLIRTLVKEGRMRPPFISPRVTWHTILYLGMLHSVEKTKYFQHAYVKCMTNLKQANETNTRTCFDSVLDSLADIHGSFTCCVVIVGHLLQMLLIAKKRSSEFS